MGDSTDEEITFNLNRDNSSQDITSDSHVSTILIPHLPFNTTESSDESLAEFSGFSEVPSVLDLENGVGDKLGGILYNITFSNKTIQVMFTSSELFNEFM